MFEGLSIKDILAHITAWEQRILTAAETARRGETPGWPEPGATMADTDRLNDRDFAASRDRPLTDVLAGARASYDRIISTLEALDERDLFDPQRFSWSRGEPLWRFWAANTSEHYREHLDQVDAWLLRTSARA